MLKRQGDTGFFILSCLIVACAIVTSSIALIFHTEAKSSKARYVEAREERLHRMQIRMDTLMELKYLLENTTGIPSPDLQKAQYTLDQLISDIELQHIQINIENSTEKDNASNQRERI